MMQSPLSYEQMKAQAQEHLAWKKQQQEKRRKMTETTSNKN